MNEVVKLEINKETCFLTILQTKVCGSTICGENLEIFILSNFNNSEKKIFILGTKDKILFDKIKTLKNTEIFVDNDYVLEKYGLSLSKHLFFQIKSGKIIYWNYIDYKTKNKIIHQLSK